MTQTLQDLLQRKGRIEQELDVIDAMMEFLRMSIQSPVDMVALGVVPAEASPMDLIIPQRVDGEVLVEVLHRLSGWTEELQAEYGALMSTSIGGSGGGRRKRDR